MLYTSAVLLLPVLAYLIGSLPWGLILTHRFAGVDVTRFGSGNIGATNVLRTAGLRLGVLTLAFDILKGAAPVYAARFLAPGAFAAADGYTALVAFAAFAGHLFPLYLKLRRGGKGVATAAGAFVVISPPACGLCLLVFAAVTAASKRVSAGSLSAAAVLPPAVGWATRSPILTGGAFAAAALIFWRHRDNLRRLADGTEPRLGRGNRNANESTTRQRR